MPRKIQQVLQSLQRAWQIWRRLYTVYCQDACVCLSVWLHSMLTEQKPISVTTWQGPWVPQSSDALRRCCLLLGQAKFKHHFISRPLRELWAWYMVKLFFVGFSKQLKADEVRLGGLLEDGEQLGPPTGLGESLPVVFFFFSPSYFYNSKTLESANREEQFSRVSPDQIKVEETERRIWFTLSFLLSL